MYTKQADLLLRLGVAFAFFFPAINALIDPGSWIGYFPPFILDSGLPETFILHAFGLIEVVIAFWIMSGKKIFVPALAATAILLVIVIMNSGDFQVLFRDLSIAAMALALAIIHKPTEA